MVVLRNNARSFGFVGVFVVLVIVCLSLYLDSLNYYHHVQRRKYREDNCTIHVEQDKIDVKNENFCLTNTLAYDRQIAISHVCQKLKYNTSGTLSSPSLTFNIHIDQEHQLAYCQIQKVGSTFFRGMLKILQLKSQTKTTLKRITQLQYLSKDEIYSLLIKSTKFVFVREPYGRALSGYVDKLFAPNPMYWKIIGTTTVRLTRGDNASKTELQCGHDVTFPEFVKYLIHSQKTGLRKEKHFYPMFEHCNPCLIHYDFIGKMETFKHDVLVLLEDWYKRYGVNITFSDFEKESDLKIAGSHTKRLYSFKPKILECMPFHSAMYRTWRDLQIRGIIPIEHDLPFTKQEADSVSQQQFIEAAANAIESVTNRTKVKNQRNEAFVEAYSLVSELDLQEYSHLFRLDFEIFGYDARPYNIFSNRSNISNTDRLKYFDITFMRQ